MSYLIHLLQLKHIDLKFLMMMGSLEMTRRTNLSGLAVLHSQNWVRKLWNCGKRSSLTFHCSFRGSICNQTAIDDHG